MGLVEILASEQLNTAQTAQMSVQELGDQDFSKNLINLINEYITQPLLNRIPEAYVQQGESALTFIVFLCLMFCLIIITTCGSLIVAMAPFLYSVLFFAPLFWVVSQYFSNYLVNLVNKQRYCNTNNSLISNKNNINLTRDPKSSDDSTLDLEVSLQQAQEESQRYYDTTIGRQPSTKMTKRAPSYDFSHIKNIKFDPKSILRSNKASDYSDDEVKIIIENLRSDRPFFPIMLGHSCKLVALCDTGAAANVIQASTLSEVERSANLIYTRFRSSSVITGLASSQPATHGVVLLPVHLDKVYIGIQEFIVIDVISPSVQVILGCKILKRTKMSLQFGEDSIQASIHVSKQRQPIKVELLPSELYSIYCVEDMFLRIGESQSFMFSLSPSHNDISVTQCTQIECHPLQWLEDSCVFTSMGNTVDGNILVQVRNESTEDFYVPKGTEVGTCTTVSLETHCTKDQIFQSSNIIYTCLCYVSPKIVLCDHYGVSGFEPRHALASPHDGDPVVPGLYFRQGDIFAVSSKRGTYDNITQKYVLDFVRKHKISYTSNYVLIYVHPAQIGFHGGKLISKLLPFFRVNTKLFSQEPTNLCVDCKDFSLLGLLPSHTSYFKIVNIYMLISKNKIRDKITVVKDKAIFNLKLHGTYITLLQENEDSLAVIIHFNSYISKKYPYFRYILLALFNKLKKYTPESEIICRCNTKLGLETANMLEKAVKTAINASSTMKEFNEIPHARKPKQPTATIEEYNFHLKDCACLHCLNKSQEIVDTLLYKGNWPHHENMAEMMPLNTDVPFLHKSEENGIKNAQNLCRSNPAEQVEVYLDPSDTVHHPRGGIIRKLQVPPEDWSKYYNFEQHPPLERYYVRLLFSRFAKTTISFSPSDRSQIRADPVRLKLVEGAKLQKRRPWPVSEDKQTAARKLIRDLEEIGLARVCKEARNISVAFAVPKTSAAKLLQLQGLPFPWRLVIDFSELSKYVDNSGDVSKVMMGSISDELSQRASSTYTSVVDAKSAFQSVLACPIFTQPYLAYTSYKLNTIYTNTTLNLGLNLCPSWWLEILSQILSDYSAQRDFVPTAIINKLKGLTPYNEVLNKDRDQCHSLYEGVTLHVDDAVIAFPDGDMDKKQILETHVALLYSLLEAYERAHVLVDVRKLVILSTKPTQVLGYVVCKNSVSIPTEKKEHLAKHLKLPDSRKSLQVYLGSHIYYSAYLVNWARKTKKLYDLLRKGVEFKMTPEHVKICEDIRESVLNSASLFVMKKDEICYICCDSSMVGYGSCIFNILEGKFHPIRYTSGLFYRKFICSASSAVLEAAGLTLTLLNSSYLLSAASRIVILTDCEILTKIISTNNASASFSPLSRLIHALLAFKPGILLKHVTSSHPLLQQCDYVSRNLRMSGTSECNQPTPIESLPLDMPSKWREQGYVISTEELLQFANSQAIQHVDSSPQDELICINQLDYYINNAISTNIRQNLSISQNLNRKNWSTNLDDIQTHEILKKPQNVETKTPTKTLGILPVEIFQNTVSEMSSTKTSMYKNIQFLTINEILHAQGQDKYINKIIGILKEHKNKSTQNLPKSYQNYVLIHKNTILAKMSKSDLSNYKIVLPLELAVVQICRLHLLTQNGINKTYKLFSTLFYTEHAYELTKSLISNCNACRLYNRPSYNHIPPGTIPKPTKILSQISLDIIQLNKFDFGGGVVVGNNENPTNLQKFASFYNVLTITDNYSQFLYCYLLKNMSENSVIDALRYFFISTSAQPELLYSDQGKQLLASSKVRNFIFKLATSKVKLSLSYHSQSNAYAECSNGLLRYNLKRLKVLFPEETFVNLLAMSTSIINTTLRRFPSFKNNILSYQYMTPYSVHYGKNDSHNLDKLLTAMGLTEKQISTYIEKQGTYLRQAQEKLEQISKEQNKKVEKLGISDGSLVLLKRAVRHRKDESIYFKDIFVVLSHFQRMLIVKNISDPSEKLLRVHFSRIKPFPISRFVNLLPENIRKYYTPTTDQEKAIQEHKDEKRPKNILKRKVRSVPKTPTELLHPTGTISPKLADSSDGEDDVESAPAKFPSGHPHIVSNNWPQWRFNPPIPDPLPAGGDPAVHPDGAEHVPDGHPAVAGEPHLVDSPEQIPMHERTHGHEGQVQETRHAVPSPNVRTPDERSSLSGGSKSSRHSKPLSSPDRSRVTPTARVRTGILRPGAAFQRLRQQAAKLRQRLQSSPSSPSPSGLRDQRGQQPRTVNQAASSRPQRQRKLPGKFKDFTGVYQPKR
jgi:hypothetical protein